MHVDGLHSCERPVTSYLYGLVARVVLCAIVHAKNPSKRHVVRGGLESRVARFKTVM